MFNTQANQWPFMNTEKKVKEDIKKFQAQAAVQSNAFIPLKDLEVRRGYAKTRKKC
jgi:hypothetical protein